MTRNDQPDDDSRAQRLLAPVRTLRRALRKWAALVGSARVVLVLTMLVLASFGLDRMFRMDRAQRIICLVFGCVVLGHMVWKYLLKPLLRSLSNETLALRLERRFPTLRGHVLTALELSRAGDPDGFGASPELVQAAVDEGVFRIAEAPREPVVQWAAAARLGAVAAAVLAVLAGLAVAYPETARLWVQRNILLSNINWPFRTHIHVEGVVDGVLRLPEGGDSVLCVRVSGEVPDQVYFEHKEANLREQMPMSADEGFRRTLRDVSETFLFRIAGGDNTTPWIRVELLPRPWVDEIRLEAIPPAYTRLAPLVFDGSESACDIPVASRVVLTGRASASLKEAWVEFEGERLAGLETDGEAFTLMIEGDSLRSGKYSVLLRDRRDIESGAPTTLAVRLVPDGPPEVKASLDGVGSLILARARVPVAVEARDDFGVQTVVLNWRKTLADGSDAAAGETPVALPPQDREPLRSWRGGAVLDLQDGAPLPIDGHVHLGVSAMDGNNVSGPGMGEAPMIDLRIVGEEELRADLIRREQSLRRQFSERIMEQRQVLEDTRIAMTGGDKAAETCPSLVRAEVTVREALPTIRIAFASLREELLNNRIEDEQGADVVRLRDGVLEPILELEKGLLPMAVARLEDAAASTDPEEKHAFLEQAVAVEQRILDQMKEIRKKMIASESMKEAVDHLRDVLHRQEELNRATETERERAIDDLFDK